MATGEFPSLRLVLKKKKKEKKKKDGTEKLPSRQQLTELY